MARVRRLLFISALLLPIFLAAGIALAVADAPDWLRYLSLVAITMAGVYRGLALESVNAQQTEHRGVRTGP